MEEIVALHESDFWKSKVVNSLSEDDIYNLLNKLLKDNSYDNFKLYLANFSEQVLSEQFNSKNRMDDIKALYAKFRVSALHEYAKFRVSALHESDFWKSKVVNSLSDEDIYNLYNMFSFNNSYDNFKLYLDNFSEKELSEQINSKNRMDDINALYVKFRVSALHESEYWKLKVVNSLSDEDIYKLINTFYFDNSYDNFKLYLATFSEEELNEKFNIINDINALYAKFLLDPIRSRRKSTKSSGYHLDANLLGELKDTLVSLQTLITKLLTQVPAPAPTPTPTSSLNKLESAVDKLVSLVSVLANKLEELHNHEEQEQEQDPVEDKLEKLNSSLERLTELIVSISKKLGRSGLVTDKRFGSMLETRPSTFPSYPPSYTTSYTPSYRSGRMSMSASL